MSYRVNISIDAKTPCLIDRATGEIIKTSFREMAASELKSLKQQGWNFNWAAPKRKGFAVYGLTIKDDDGPQGLIAIKPDRELEAIFVKLVENAPHNVGSQGQYEGVGAHLFAIAAKKSFKWGYDGYVIFDAKTKLINHYKKELNAKRIGNSHRMIIDTAAAEAIVNKYFSGEDNE